ncbi:hypothetical protein LX97_00690 [Nonlabens dokdonensis]|jgi:hypothetical protein|uniref:30S ribosomal protein S16 n=2 Tax=Nonlabens dokdonensis TaxID=328515 RepID=L7W886_NONDD|nr:DUF6252 family protein [Nonlabens dokdonensis]AGC76016.1 30S ribosomal protein S16 [Nonlabens dokdonensis DSW-6]PZX43688.1 hypothetical protein LX97_00690 [Nonlabens dokdonensis]
MKTIGTYLLIALAVFSFISCEENLDDDNVPALQAVRNGEFFKSDRMSATLNDDGSLSLFGQTPLETLELRLEDDSVGIYRLGSGSQSEALYTFNGADTFSTNFGNGTGEVRLTSVNAISGVTGEFSFVSYLANNADSLYMRRGVIFQVPFGTALGSGAGGAVSNSFNATIDGSNLNPTLINGVANGGILAVTGSNGNGSIVLTMPDSVVPGTYMLSGAGSTYSASYVEGSNVAQAVSGDLIITAADAANNTVSGTFNFMTGPPDNFDVTNGSFIISY